MRNGATILEKLFMFISKGLKQAIIDIQTAAAPLKADVAGNAAPITIPSKPPIPAPVIDFTKLTALGYSVCKSLSYYIQEENYAETIPRRARPKILSFYKG